MSIAKEVLISFQKNIKNKTTNPYLGTVLVIWFIHQWEFIYKVLHFGETSLDDRLIYMRNFLNPEPLSESIWFSLKWGILILIGSYLIINFSRLIVAVFDNVINEWVSKLIDVITRKTNTISKNKYLDIKSERDDYERKYNAEREKRIEIESERNVFEKKYLDNRNEHTPEGYIYYEISNLEYLEKIPDVVKTINSKGAIRNFPQTLINALFENGVILKDVNTNEIGFTPLGLKFLKFYMKQSSGNGKFDLPPTMSSSYALS